MSAVAWPPRWRAATSSFWIISNRTRRPACARLLKRPVLRCATCRPTRRISTQFELLFAKLKALLRKAAEREIEALWTRIGKLLDAFTSEECAAYLRHAGYAAN